MRLHIILLCDCSGIDGGEFPVAEARARGHRCGRWRRWRGIDFGRTGRVRLAASAAADYCFRHSTPVQPSSTSHNPILFLRPPCTSQKSRRYYAASASQLKLTILQAARRPARGYSAKFRPRSITWSPGRQRGAAQAYIRSATQTPQNWRC